ncbi:hypothetical protein REMIM1_PC00209 (plasmid) [Rhizobium etli bv. mimosae str. Mim1]|nr:hypothetical protein REMIM1_PC00209 [Rhizobium etli bv. mimosae str. Mim1]
MSAAWRKPLVRQQLEPSNRVHRNRSFEDHGESPVAPEYQAAVEEQERAADP